MNKNFQPANNSNLPDAAVTEDNVTTEKQESGCGGHGAGGGCCGQHRHLKPAANDTGCCSH